MPLGLGVRMGRIDDVEQEIGVAVSVGPAFARPRTLEDGGPIVLGFELGYRRYAWPAENTGLTPFATAFARADARLPGFDPGVVLEHLRASEGSAGFDASSGEYVDLMEAGILDPTKVVRIALENAVSVAGTLLLTEATLTEIEEPADRKTPAGGEPYD